MTREKQRIAIATACGWKSPTLPEVAALQDGWLTSGEHWLSPSGVLRPAHHMPDYLNDLNAMHEAEKVLTEKGVNAWWTYVGFIHRHNPTPFGTETAVHATAPQRAEAFLRTLGLWEETL